MFKAFLGLALLIMVVPRCVFSLRPPTSKELAFNDLLLPTTKIPNYHLSFLERVTHFNAEFKPGTILEGGIFDGIFPKLIVLQIVNSNLESIHANAISGLKNLKQLFIKNTNITGFLNSMAFRNLPSLQILHLDGCRIPKLSPQTLDRLPSLMQVVFNRNKMFSIEGNALHKLPLLSHLTLSFNDVEEIRPNAFSNLPKLDFLQLAENRFKTLHHECFHNLPNLRHMVLSGNRIKTFRPNAFKNMWNVERMELIRNKISKLPTNSFYNYPKLKVLDIWYNTIQEIEPYAFYAFPALEVLHLRGNKIKVVKSYAFYDLRYAKTIELWGNEISVIEPLAFKGLPKPNPLPSTAQTTRNEDRISLASKMKRKHVMKAHNVEERQQDEKQTRRPCTPACMCAPNPCSGGNLRMNSWGGLKAMKAHNVEKIQQAQFNPKPKEKRELQKANQRQRFSPLAEL